MTMKRPLLTPLAAALCLVGMAAHATDCQNNIPATNPDAIYTVHSDGTVTDNRTGLMWKQCLEGQDSGNNCAGSGTYMDWATALSHAETHTFAGHSDWRLPDSKELESLVEYCRKSPAINREIFLNALSSDVWSGSPNAGNSNDAWYVNFYYGSAGLNDRSLANHVRLVRAGQSFAPLPALSAVALQGTPTASSATVAGTSSQTGTGYWLAVPQGSTAPTAAQVKAGANYGSVTVAAQGSAAMTASVAASFTATGLSAATAYDFYLVAEASGQLSALAGPVAFTTAAAPVAGACGSAHNTTSTPLLTSAPSSDLCSAGTPSTVTGGTSTWGWTCAASTTATCQAPRGYSVTPSGGAGGSISPSTAQAVAYNASTSFTVTPSSGYGIATVSGCGGSLAGSTYTTGAVSTDCTVNASFSPLPPSTHSISVAASPAGSGSVACSPNPVPHGSNASVLS